MPANGKSASEERQLGFVGKYRLIAALGEGGMARVHLALMRGPAGFNKLLVIKSVREDLVGEHFAKMFLHEARLAAQLNHPNVVQTYEVSEDRGRFYLAMEHLDGQSLRAVQRAYAPRRLPLVTQIRILTQVAHGLHHAHTLRSFDDAPLSVVHRDVSPQNVFLTYDGQVKLLDFGIAKVHGGENLTRTGMIKGKIDYMAPEQLQGDKIDARADIFALGVMLWEGIAACRFSGGATMADVTKMHNRVMGTEAKLRDVAPDAPQRLVEICERAISLDPNQRQASAAEFAQELEAYCAETSQRADARQLADILTTLFERERKQLQAIIEEQVRRASSPDADVDEHSLPVLKGLDVSGSSHTDDRSGDAAMRSVREVTSPTSPGKGATRRPLVIASVLGVGVAISVALLAASSRATRTREPESHRVATKSSVAARRDPVPSPAAPVSVHVHIDVEPAGARARMDGVSIALPFDVQVTPDARLHRLEVEAPGYAAQTLVVTFARDTSTHVMLQPEDVAPERASAARPSARRGDPGAEVADPPASISSSPPPAAPPSAPAVETAPGRQVDTEDPYQ